MEPGKLIVGLLVFIMMVIGGTMIIADINYNYAESGVDMDTEFYGKMENLSYASYYDINKTGQGGMTNVFTPLDEETTESSMFKGGFKALKLITSTPTLIYNIAQEFGKTLPVPRIFIDLFFAALTIMLMFSVIYIVFRIAKG